MKMKMPKTLALVVLMMGCDMMGESPVVEAPEPISEAPDLDEPDAMVADMEIVADNHEELTEEEMNRRGMLVSTVQVAEMVRRSQARRRAWTGSLDVDRGPAWNVPNETGVEATIEGLHRVCGSEIEWQNDRDCIGIWYVIENIRSRHCDRGRIDRITECVGGQETHLSAMRRASRVVMGMRPPRSARQRWMRNVTLACDVPDGFPTDRASWSAIQDDCLRHAQLARDLVTRVVRPRFTQARPLTWGGRCELTCEDPTDPATCSRRGACDDRGGCARNLNRIPNAGTTNAFWCRPGSPGCPTARDPICITFGFPEFEVASTLEADEGEAEDVVLQPESGGADREGQAPVRALQEQDRDLEDAEESRRREGADVRLLPPLHGLGVGLPEQG